MEKLRLSFLLLFVFTFLCTANSNPITSLFGKSDDKAEGDEKTDEKAAVTTTTAKAAGETTTTTTTTATPEPSSSCGGLKGFLHMCDKPEPTEPPKSVKTRSVPQEEDSDEDSDSDDDSDEQEEGESQQEGDSQQETETTAEAVAKRQVDDLEAPILGEVPPMVGDAMAPPADPSESDAEDDGKVEKRQTEDTDSNSDSDEDKSEEVMEGSRKRRDCRDGDGDYVKNCRKRRELVPTCTQKDCKDTTGSP